jgi:hypothetical protein
MKASGILSAALCSTLAGCLPSTATENPGDSRGVQTGSAHPADATFTLAQLGEFIELTARQSPAERQAVIERLKDRAAKPAGDRLKLAYLLSLENATADELAQACKLLDGLDAEFGDRGVRLYARLLQRTAMTEAAYARETAKNEESVQKLKQIKKLELDLIQRNQSPAPSPTQSPAK